MNDYFSPQHPIVKLLTLFCNLILLNIIFIITCLPILTIGAALAAAYRTLFHIRTEKTPVVFATYVKSFRAALPTATPLWIILLLGCAFFGADLYLVLFSLPKQYNLLQIPVWCMLFLLLSVAIYAFPLLSLYEIRGFALIKTAVLLSLANIPTTVFILVVELFLTYLALSSLYSLAIMMTLGVFFGFALVMYLFSFFLFRIFKKCEG